MENQQLFINGVWCDAVDSRTFETNNPATGIKIADIASAGIADVQKAVQVARHAFEVGTWTKLSGKNRATYLYQVADALASRADEFAYLEAIDSGTTIRKAKNADVPGAIAAFRWFAELTETQSDDMALPGSTFPQSQNYIRYEPYGVCAGITPWNFPLLMAAWKIAPVLATGNTCIIKPPSLAPMTTLLLVDLFSDLDMPPGVLQVLTGPGEVVGNALVSSPLVDKVAFTGSTQTGKEIMTIAAQSIKPVTLELGGKSANIVLDDADLDQAVATVLWGTFLHNGQACESGTRALIHESIYGEFVEKLCERAQKIKIGDQLDPGTDLGPMIHRSQVKTVSEYVEIGKKEVGDPLIGGRVLMQDELPENFDAEAFYLPTIFSPVSQDARIWQEEIFGPVLCVTPFSDDIEAVALANNSSYGLAAGVQSQSINRAESLAMQLKAGTVWINDYHLISSKRPFGGYKQSGIGRELGLEGFNAYRQIKHVHINPETTGRENHGHYGLLGKEL